ncbi:MAG: hypothetical protein JWM71_2629 [Solirubrobacteraceae bacterium]|nr:hypothetical protein [Solirubrobacteraceae bacterium]
MGRRTRSRGKVDKLRAPESEYRDAEGNVLVLRGSLSPLTRHRYQSVVHDQSKIVEDSWHRAVEFLFERLVVRWIVFEVPTEGQKELLARFRMATQAERRWIRDVLREHLAEHFPDLEAP